MSPRRTALALAVGVLLAAGCSSTPESPWATEQPADLPFPTTDESPEDGPDPTADAPRSAGPAEIGVTVVDGECLGEEVRCGVVLVPQVAGSADLVAVGFRVLSETGTGTPVAVLLDGTGRDPVGTEDFPDRPLVVVGSRGLDPGGPNLTCPEFYAARADDDVADVMEGCVARLRAAGVDPHGTLPTALGHDTGLVLRALGIEEVDLLVPTWRALSTASIGDHVAVRRIVYSSPWFATDRSLGPAEAARVSLDAVWARCDELASCSAPGSVADFLDAVAGLDERPLADTTDTFSDEPAPIDSSRLAGAIVSATARASDLAYLPRLHRAIDERDAATVSAFVRASANTSVEVNLLGVTCTLFDPGSSPAVTLPTPLRTEADDAVEVFADACGVWPSETDGPPTGLPSGLTVLTRSVPAAGRDYSVADDAGPLIVEPTVGLPTPGCLRTAARAWFDDEQVDDTGCSTPLTIGDRDETITTIRGVYETADATIELSVPDSWDDSGAGTWWRDADPVDLTNLDVYVWDATDAESARTEVLDGWGLVSTELSASQVGDRIWLMASAHYPDDETTVLRIATSMVDGVSVVVILETHPEEAGRLAGDVLEPALLDLVVR